MYCAGWLLECIQIYSKGRFRNGQWHVYDYGGFQEQSGTTRACGQQLEGRTDITGKDQYKTIMDAGDQNIRTYMHNIASARATLPSSALSDNPVTGRAAAQEFQQQQSVEPISAGTGREVVVILYRLYFLDVS